MQNYAMGAICFLVFMGIFIAFHTSGMGCPATVAGDLPCSPVLHSRPSAVAVTGVIKLPQDVTRLVINIGSSVDPPVPTLPGQATIAFEPLIAAANQIPSHPRVFVVCAAVSNYYGMATFQKDTTRKGDSSSLGSVNGGKYSWLIAGMTPIIVPVVPLAAVLDSFAPTVTLDFLKTDMQGFDFVAVGSIGERIRRFETVEAEVYRRGWRTYAENANSFEDVKTKYMFPSPLLPILFVILHACVLFYIPIFVFLFFLTWIVFWGSPGMGTVHDKVGISAATKPFRGH